MVSTILITLELFYSTKTNTKISCVTSSVTKVINRAINDNKEIKDEKEGKKTGNDKRQNQQNNNNKNKSKRTNQIYIINTETLNVEPDTGKGSVTQKANAFSSHIYNIDIYILSPSDWTITKYSILSPSGFVKKPLPRPPTVLVPPPPKRRKDDD